MKPGIHPENFRLVVFKDMSNDYMFIAKSCTATKDTVKYTDGNEYPLVKIDISHTSHPFYTGKMMLVDTAGRVDKFKKRFAKHVAMDEASQDVATKKVVAKEAATTDGTNKKAVAKEEASAEEAGTLPSPDPSGEEAPL